MKHSVDRCKRQVWAGLLVCSSLVGPTWAAASPPVPVFAAQVVTATFADRIEALGTLRANESITLTASVTDKISALYFDDGLRVAAGEPLVEMTSAEEHAQLEEARAFAEEADRQYRRVLSLAKQGTESRSLLDERRSQLESARARLTAIESRLTDRLIKAPFAGVVGLRNISVGALVEPGDTIATLDDDSVMKLDLAVPSVFMARLKPGLTVAARTRAYRDREFSGEIRSIDSRADPVSRSVLVRVMVPNDERLLKPGMLMQVTLFKDPRETLMIPEGAIMPSGREQFVLVAEPDGVGHKAQRRLVEIGSRRPGQVEIINGLAAGELVITDGGMRVRPGQPVVIRAIDDGTQPLTKLLKGKAQAAAPDATQ